MSTEKVELNWMHRFRKFLNRIPSVFTISFHWISFSLYIPPFGILIGDIEDSGLQILNLKINKALSREDSSRQFLYIQLTILNCELYICLYRRNGFYIQIDVLRLAVGSE